MVERDFKNVYRAPASCGGVGATLRGAREASGKTMLDVASESRIPVEYIHAFETESYHVLPGWAYALSYVRTYAEYLGLDASSFVKQVRKQIEIRQHLAVPAAPSRGNWTFGRIAASISILLVVGLIAGWYVIKPAVSLTTILGPVPTDIKELINRTFVAVDDSASDIEISVGGNVGKVASAEVSSTPQAMAYSATLFESPTIESRLSVGLMAQDLAPIGGSLQVKFAPLRDRLGLANKVIIATHPRDTVDRSYARIKNVILRAKTFAWLIVEDSSGRSLLSQQIDKGSLYRLPTGSGFTVTTNDAGAFEVYLEGTLAGIMGPVGSEITKLPVDRLTEHRADG
jgi:cytoskeleton protein RodZ